jgi:hypothetical protein
MRFICHAPECQSQSRHLKAMFMPFSANRTVTITRLNRY